MKKLLMGLAGILLLSGCWPERPKELLSFPDDPRVLHGTWTLIPELPDFTAHFEIGQAANNIVMYRPSESHRQFNRSAAGEAWTEVEAVAPIAPYDAALDRFVWTRRDHNRNLLVRLIDFDGGTSETTIPDFDYSSWTRLHGRIVAWSDDVDLYWWDATAPAQRQQVSMPAHPDGFTTNSRSIAFWNLDQRLVTVLDAADFSQPVELDLDSCTTHTFHRASHDGRWFLTANCDQEVLAYDLINPHAAPVNLGADPFGGSMARDSAEILWLAEDSRSIRSVDLESVATSVLYEFSREASAALPAANQAMYLSRTHNLLVLSDRGHLLTVEPGASQGQVLPEPEIGIMQLELEAVAEMQSRFTRYEVTGTWEWSGDNYAISGTANGGSYHVYGPSALTPAMTAPPPPRASLEVSAPDGTVLWNLHLDYSLGSDDPRYFGSLSQPGREGRSYHVELVR